MHKPTWLRSWTLARRAVALAFVLAAPVLPEAQAQQQKPNILVIMGDDIGWFNPSIYHRGMMGYQTPNIDRIAKEGAMFTDWYGQQSCTAGRAAFVTGQSPIRTGLTKVGLPGADIGLQADDPSIAEILKPLGYATGQFGKNHLGDKASPRKEFLYWSDDGELIAIRVNEWKISFKEQEHKEIDVWRREFTNLRAPKIYNLRADPFEQGDTSFEYDKWMAERAFLIVPSQAVVGQWLSSFKEFPIRQKPASFNLDEVMQKLSSAQKR